MARPAANYWNKGASPALWPGLNTRDAQVLDYVDERATDLQEAIESLGGEDTYGYAQPGGNFQPMTGSVKMASPIVVGKTGRAIAILLDLGGSGGSSTQTMRAQVHGDSSGNPAAKLAETAEVTIPGPQTRGIVRIPIPELQQFNVTAGQTVWAGWFGGGVGGAMSYGYSNQSGGQLRYVSDTYSNGSEATFAPVGGVTTINNQVLSVRLVIADNFDPTAIQADIDALDTAVTTANSNIATLSSAVSALQGGTAGGGAAIDAAIEIDDPEVPTGTVIYGEPFDLNDGNVAQVVASLEGDQTGTLSVRVGPTGGPFVTRASASPGLFADLALLTRQEQARIVYTQGGTQGAAVVTRAVTR